MSTFRNWTEAEIAAHNARVAGVARVVAGEGCDNEAKLHEQIIEACKARGFYYVHSRMDRRTTNAIGTPDFVIAAESKTYWIEAKAKGKKLTREQRGTLLWLRHLGHPAACVYSLEDFLTFIDNPTASTDPEKP